MDAVILAGGRGGRVVGLVPPYHKPLLPVNGEPNITRLTHLADEVAERVVIVTAPENTLAIASTVADLACEIIVQRFPHGPGAALLTGLQLCEDDTVLVLLSDNIVSLRDVLSFERKHGVGCRRIPVEDAVPFTRFDHYMGRWVEKVPISNDQLKDGEVLCWVGPLIISCDHAITALDGAEFVDGEQLIGPYISDLAVKMEPVIVDSIDIGTVANYHAAIMNGEKT